MMDRVWRPAVVLVICALVGFLGLIEAAGPVRVVAATVFLLCPGLLAVPLFPGERGLSRLIAIAAASLVADTLAVTLLLVLGGLDARLCFMLLATSLTVVATTQLIRGLQVESRTVIRVFD